MFIIRLFFGAWVEDTKCQCGIPVRCGWSGLWGNSLSQRSGYGEQFSCSSTASFEYSIFRIHPVLIKRKYRTMEPQRKVMTTKAMKSGLMGAKFGDSFKCTDHQGMRRRKSRVMRNFTVA